MEALQLRKAERRKAKLKIGVTAPSGAGKTFSSLLLAAGLIQDDWSKIAVIDTENGSGDLYADSKEMGPYNVITLEAPFTPERYIEAIKACEAAGMRVIIIDSATHEWDGKGGCLEIQEQLGGRYQDWAKVTPRHRKFLEAILQSPCDIITTTRRKQDYDMTKGSDGRVRVEKVGLKEVQREGFEYELTLNFEIASNHLAKASKDRTGLFADKPEFMISKNTGKILRDWAASGSESLEEVEAKAKAKARKELNIVLKVMGGTEDYITKQFGDIATMSSKKLGSIVEQLKELKKKRDAEKVEVKKVEEVEVEDQFVPDSEMPKKEAPAVEGAVKDAEIVKE